jgi:hypothetical protein
MSAFPKIHAGTPYTDALAQLSLKRAVARYFEIGVQAGRNLSRIPCEHAIGVDPAFQITQNVAGNNKKRVSLFQTTSDRYFNDYDTYEELGGPVDLAFLDGMHLFEYLLRDFYNTEAVCSPQSLIAIHDCMPLNAIMAGRNEQQVAIDAKGTDFERYWTGDVWKIVPILRKYRPDLHVLLIDCPPTGLVLVTNLDPGSTALQDNYLQIVGEFAAIPNDNDNILRMYEENSIRSSSDILNGFDHSLYLKA